MKNFPKRGFTLIELLVVIAIIGVLASIVLASLDSSRKKGRDARRLADVKQIQLALELYYDQNNSFPPNIANSSTCGAQTCAATYLTGPGYISVVPTDPSSGRDYSYTPYYASGGALTLCTSYHLGASLETVNHTAFQTDKDQSAQATVCTATYAPSADFDGSDFLPVASTNPHKCNNNDAGLECYDVTP